VRWKPVKRPESPPTSGLSAALHPPPKLIERVLAVATRVHIPLLASALTFDALLALIPLGVLGLESLRLVLEQTSTLDPSDPTRLFTTLLPRHFHVDSTADPFHVVEGLFATVQRYSLRLTWIAVPVFLWFGSRLFASLRSCLSQVFSARPPKRSDKPALDFLLGFLYGKLRDFGMIGVLLALAGVNALLSVAVVVFNTDTVYLSGWLSFFASTLGRVFAEFVTIGSAFLLFALLYRYASPRRLPWRGSVVAAGTATFGFELAKRLYGLYLTRSSGGAVYSIDAGIGAVLFFLLWVWWVALVFLIGAAAAMIWESGQAATGDAERVTRDR
jgi:uncharacterized BrkB/YihY/UPF0761 family membrane protein